MAGDHEDGLNAELLQDYLRENPHMNSVEHTAITGEVVTLVWTEFSDGSSPDMNEVLENYRALFPGLRGHWRGEPPQDPYERAVHDEAERRFREEEERKRRYKNLRVVK